MLCRQGATSPLIRIPDEGRRWSLVSLTECLPNGDRWAPQAARRERGHSALRVATQWEPLRSRARAFCPLILFTQWGSLGVKKWLVPFLRTN